ncbi:MAG: phosphatase PAP2 family protein [Lachnospiraceae bacterium]|nr:phosphatase PAP2 family protein [Lachnospiraceae bacterium]
MLEKISAAWRSRYEKGYISRLERLIPTVVYLFFYFCWFFGLEKIQRSRYVLMHTKLDDRIPFRESFVIPYYSWFFYVGFTLTFLLLLRRSQDYYRAIIFMGIGMTFFLIFSTFVPTMQTLRPETMPRDNIYTHLVDKMYRTDTPTNVFPSLHVFNSISCAIALLHAKALEKHKWVRAGSVVLTAMIILSTMFIKQHSVLDVTGGIIMAVVLYPPVYRTDWVVRVLHIREREFNLPEKWSLF